jgi:hypothetical protein
MPAIQLARLRQQASELAALYKEPVLFSRRFRLLLEQYADHTQRYAQNGETSGMMPAYNVPQPVIRQFVLEMKPIIKSDPAAIITLATNLWEENTWEYRKLALHLLGQISQSPQSMQNLLSQWLATHPEERIIEEAMQFGAKNLRQEFPAQYLEMAKNWLESPDIFFRKCGFYALIILAEDSDFENLPLLLRLVAPRIRIIPVDLRAQAIQLITSLARRIPGETAFFLRTNLEAPQNPDTAWLVRQVLPVFPAEIQVSLKKSLRSQ